MNKPEITDEAKRLRDFITHLKMSNTEFAAAIDKTLPMVTKYCSGVVKIPVDLVKDLHEKFKLNFTWFFTGVGPKQMDKPEKKITHDIGYLIMSIKSMEAQMEQMNTKINKMARDLYAAKHSV